jgi:signal transduction histidine kinase
VRLFRTSSFRLTAIFALAFLLSTATLGVSLYIAVGREISREFDERITEESDALQRLFSDSGVQKLAKIIDARATEIGSMEYGLFGFDGKRLAGVGALRNDAGGKPILGWTQSPEVESDEPPEGEKENVRALIVKLADGSMLLVGDERRLPDKAMAAILFAFGWASAAALALALIGGIWSSAQFLKSIANMRAAAHAIMRGDWSRRIDLSGFDDDFATLGRSFNRLFERIEKLLLANKHVSMDLAHDLRKPLARTLRRLEAALQHGVAAKSREAAVSGAMADIEGVLDLFDALLRIGRVEAGARRSAFRPLNLAEIAREAVEAFQPSAEEGGRVLEARLEAPFALSGDRDLLMQMIANLLDNALRHTPVGTTIEVRTSPDSLVVADDGPGVPEKDLAAIFHRFHRGPTSAPGSGLGLSLVAAIAEMHDLECGAFDNRPGLNIVIRRTVEVD